MQSAGIGSLEHLQKVMSLKGKLRDASFPWKKVDNAIFPRHHPTTLLFHFGSLILILIPLLGHNNL